MGRGDHGGPSGHVAFALVVLLALALPVTPVSGQIPPLPAQAFGVEITVDRTAASLEPGGSVAFGLVVKNTGQFPLGSSGAGQTITLQASPPPTGWSGTIESGKRTLQLEPDETATVTFTVSVAENAEARTASFTVTATVEESTQVPGQEPATDSVSFTASVEEDFFAGLTNQLGDNAILLVLAGVGGLVIILAVLATRRKGEVVMHCPEPAKEVPAGSGTSYPILVENRSRSRESVSLFTTEAPPGWETFLPLAEISLSGREQETIWLSVKAPRAARPGEQVLVKVVASPSSDPDSRSIVETMTTVSRAGRAEGITPVRSGWDDSAFESESSVLEEEPRVAVKRPTKAS